MGFYSRKSGVFKRFFDRRDDLINQLDEGKLSKKQFLEHNYNLVRRSSVQPFLRIDSYEMGMYNYQYYNVLAKYFNMLANESRKAGRASRQFQEYWNKGNNYYNEKDKATLALLKFLEFKDMDAYYIEMNSRSLEGELFEIVLLKYDKAIFHSKAQWLLDILEEKGVFSGEFKKSIIDEYINETY